VIGDWRLTIEKVVWQFLPMSISTPRRENRQSPILNPKSTITNHQSKIANSSHPEPSDDRRNSSQKTNKFGASAGLSVRQTYLKFSVLPEKSKVEG